MSDFTIEISKKMYKNNDGTSYYMYKYKVRNKQGVIVAESKYEHLNFDAAIVAAITVIAAIAIAMQYEIVEIKCSYNKRDHKFTFDHNILNKFLQPFSKSLEQVAKKLTEEYPKEFSEQVTKKLTKKLTKKRLRKK